MWRDCVEGRVVDDDWQNADDAVSVPCSGTLAMNSSLVSSRDIMTYETAHKTDKFDKQQFIDDFETTVIGKL